VIRRIQTRPVPRLLWVPFLGSASMTAKTISRIWKTPAHEIEVDPDWENHEDDLLRIGEKQQRQKIHRDEAASTHAAGSVSPGMTRHCGGTGRPLVFHLKWPTKFARRNRRLQFARAAGGSVVFGRVGYFASHPLVAEIRT